MEHRDLHNRERGPILDVQWWYLQRRYLRKICWVWWLEKRLGWGKYSSFGRQTIYLLDLFLLFLKLENYFFVNRCCLLIWPCTFLQMDVTRKMIGLRRRRRRRKKKIRERNWSFSLFCTDSSVRIRLKVKGWRARLVMVNTCLGKEECCSMHCIGHDMLMTLALWVY